MTSDVREGGLTLIQSNALDVFEDRMGSISETCRAVGVHRSTFYRWQDESDEFSERVADIREGLIDRTESKLHAAIGTGSVPAIMFHLKTKGRNRGYVERAPDDKETESDDERLLNEARKRHVAKYTPAE